MPIVLLLASASAAEPSVTPEIQVRPRYEADTGRDQESGGEVHFVTHRARLGATFASGPLAVRVVFQDVRAWGEELDTRRDFSGDGIDLPIGTVTWTPTESSWLILGRDELGLHDERLLARANWRQPGRHFDGGRAGFADGTWAAEAAGFVAVDGDVFQFDTQDQVEPGVGDQLLFYARGGLEKESLVLQPVVLVDSRRSVPGDEVLRITPGVFFKGDAGAVHGGLEVYGQLGSIGGGAESVRAWLLGVHGGLAPDIGGKPLAELHYDGFSGDADPGDGVFTRFDTVRGANHRYWGHLDNAVFFRGGPNGNQGLHDAYLRLQISPVEALRLKLDQHLFAPQTVSGGDDRWLAYEPDLEFGWTLQEAVTLSGGVAAWLEADQPLEGFGYLMLDVNWKGPTVGAAE